MPLPSSLWWISRPELLNQLASGPNRAHSMWVQYYSPKPQTRKSKKTHQAPKNNKKKITNPSWVGNVLPTQHHIIWSIEMLWKEGLVIHQISHYKFYLLHHRINTLIEALQITLCSSPSTIAKKTKKAENTIFHIFLPSVDHMGEFHAWKSSKLRRGRTRLRASKLVKQLIPHPPSKPAVKQKMIH